MTRPKPHTEKPNGVSPVTDDEPKRLRPGDRAPISYFELERRAQATPELPTEIDTKVPAQPPNSPWFGDQLAEPQIDRSSEDGDVFKPTTERK